MPFALPTFNLRVNVWHSGGAVPAGPPDLTPLTNFSLGRRQSTGTDQIAVSAPGSGVGIDVFLRIMMLPAGTDIRGRYATGGSDVVEAPQGTGAFYLVSDVADMAKAFANEHRVAWLIPFFATPFPNPLP